MQTPTQSSDSVEVEVDNGMIHCHHNSINNDSICKDNCCNDIELDQGCKDCTNSCTSTTHIYFDSVNISQFISNFIVMYDFRFTFSSRKITPPFRPPITTLS